MARTDPVLEIVYRDRWLAVVVKPPGLASQSTRDPDEPTLEERVRVSTRADYVAVHHRLDRDAQGLMVLGLHREANRGLASAFRERHARRVYRALVHGVLEGEGQWRHLQQRRRGRRVAVTWTKGGAGEEMVLRWAAREQRGMHSLVEFELETGRTHQIRLQAAAQGHPIVGDRRYGFGETGGLRLQSCALGLEHPVTGEDLYWELPEPVAWIVSSEGGEDPGDDEVAPQP